MKLPIISLTSHGKRIDNAYKTIESLLKMKDFEKIVLYINKETFSNAPTKLLNMVNERLKFI